MPIFEGKNQGRDYNRSLKEIWNDHEPSCEALIGLADNKAGYQTFQKFEHRMVMKFETLRLKEIWREYGLEATGRILDVTGGCSRVATLYHHIFEEVHLHDGQ